MAATVALHEQGNRSLETSRGEDPAAQFRAGMLGGVALGLVPFAGVGEQILDKADVLPQTSYSRQGVAIGQIFGGLACILVGVTGGVGGGLLSTTGLGAALGVPAMAVSAGLITAGLSNIGAGVYGMMTTGSGSSSPKVTAPAAQEGLKWGNSKSTPTYGHTFAEHGAGAKRTAGLLGEARGTGKPQGQWLDNQKAADFLAQQRPTITQPTTVGIPQGLGQVIRPDGTIVPAAYLLHRERSAKTAVPAWCHARRPRARHALPARRPPRLHRCAHA